MAPVRLAAFVLATSLAAQYPPPPPPPPVQRPADGQPARDTVRRPEPTGTAVIRGRVVAADTGNPIKRANVTLMPVPVIPPSVTNGSSSAPVTITARGGVPSTMITGAVINGQTVMMGRPQSVTTDSQGSFEFKGLPAGSYRLTAGGGQYSAAYLGMSYGATRPSGPGLPGDPGTPIQVTDGQRFESAVIALPRGSVITGRVADENGEPMARVQVYPMFFPAGSTRPIRSGGSSSTDDLGNFRIFGLPPGEYVVVAEMRGPMFAPPNAPPQSEEDKIGYLTTYFPNTPDESSAQRVRTRLGAETPGVEIRMVSGRLFTVSGLVTDSQGRSSSRMQGTLMRSGIGSFTSYGFSTDEQGRFQMRNVPPGNYKLIVRGRLPSGPGEQMDMTEMAAVPIAVSADLEGVVIVTGPGATISGTIVFEQGPPTPSPTQTQPLRVNAVIADPQTSGPVPTPQAAVVTPDFKFTMKGFMGEFLLRANAPGQYLKSVMVGAEDITDTPREFKNGDRVTITMTSAASTLEGTVTDAKGAPVTDASIIVFSEDKAAWRSNSVRTRRSSTDPNGHFRMTGLLAGRYYAVAIPRDRANVPPSNQDVAYFDALARDATTLVVGEGDQRQIDLKLVPLSNGG